jgi:hypothetical protein
MWFVFQPEGCCRQEYGNLSHDSDEEIHAESQPDDQPGALEAPNFSDAVVDDVRDGEYNKSGGQGNGSKLQDFSL